jgi:hypothetical protein
MENRRYPIEVLKKWQDDILELAKKKLRDDGELRPVAFFLTEVMNLDEGVKKIAVALDTGDGSSEPKVADFSTANPADTVIIVLDLLLNSQQALEVIKQTLPPEQTAFISVLELQGHRFGVKNPSEGLVKVLMQKMNITIKDIVARAVEIVIRKTDAIAYIKLDETWMVEAKDKKTDDILKFNAEHGSLENHPDAKEAITSFLETEGFVRMVSINFRRNRPKTGRIIGFDEAKELIETPETAHRERLDGTFAHLFDKSKLRPKPPTPAGAN